MLINGQEQTFPQPLTLQELLHHLGYRTNLVAVERNGAIVKRSEYASTMRTMLTDADKVEIVSFVGGG